MTAEPNSREQRLDGLIAAYLEAVDTGQAPDRPELPRRRPEVAVKLEESAAPFRFSRPGGWG